MDQNLKQRLVGALVLMSLAVIFLPLVFDGQQQRIDTKPYEIPAPPVISLQSMDMPPVPANALAGVNADRESPAQAAATATVDDSPATASEPVPTPAAPPATPPPGRDEVARFVEQEKQADAAIRTTPHQQPVDLADAWIIQVGAFSSQANADALRNRIAAGGYAVFVRPQKTASGQFYKVYVGPEIRRYRVEQQKQALEQKYQVKALILKHIP